MTDFFQQLVNGLSWGAIYALIALGYTMVYGVLRLINFAHGDVYMVGAMVGYSLSRFFHFSSSPLQFFSVLFLTMLICAALGFLIERIAYRPLRHSPRLTALITAIGVSLLLEYGGQIVFGAEIKYFPDLIVSKPIFAGSGVMLNNIQLLIIFLSLALMAALHFFVKKTKTGMAMRAVSYSPTASQFVGIPLNRIISITFMIGSALAGAAGILVGLSNKKIDTFMGLLPGLKGFVAAVLGGIGSIPGALIGGFVLGLVETFTTAYLSSTYRDAIAFILLILILLFKPNGLLGKKTIEKI